MLASFCAHTFISCKAEQAHLFPAIFPLLADDPQFGDCGPVAALLTAWQRLGPTGIFVMACDYPLLTTQHWQVFQQQNPEQKTAAFYKTSVQLYEPLLAFYPAACHDLLLRMHASGQYALQYFLKETDAVKIILQEEKVLQSIDTKEEYEAIKQVITNPAAGDAV
jgi:molybdenum cofactor guanylyltransferase